MRLPVAALMLVVAVGLALGVGAYTFVYARGASYITNDPSACVNCHVMREQYDHDMRRPLRNVNHACQTCHRWSEDELTARVRTIQQRTFELRNRAMDALTALIGDIKGAVADGRTDARLASARDFQRNAQFYLDFVEAENSTGFHAPQEAARILAESIDFTRQGQLALREPRRR